MTELPAPPDHRLLILKPEQSAETALIYRVYDEQESGSGKVMSVEPVVQALRKGDLSALALSLGNDLTRVTRDFVSDVAEYERNLLGSGALGASMSGTGTAVYGLFDAEEAARVSAASFKAPFSGVYEPVFRGVKLL